MAKGYRYKTKTHRAPAGGRPPGVPPQPAMYTPRPAYWSGHQAYAITQNMPASAYAVPGYQWPGAASYPWPAYGAHAANRSPFAQQQASPYPYTYAGYAQPQVPVYNTPPPPVPPPTLKGATQPIPGVAGGTPSTLAPGARIRGQLPVFPNRNSTHLTAGKIVTFHVIRGTGKPWMHVNPKIEFQVVTAESGMRICDFMKAIGLEKIGKSRAPPLELGICEVMETGNGKWKQGSKFVMGDPLEKQAQTLAEVGWDELRGEAGKGKPIWLSCLP